MRALSSVFETVLSETVFGPSPIIGLPALQKASVNHFFEFAWGFGSENDGNLWRIFCGLRFSRYKARKLLGNFGAALRRKIRTEKLKNSGAFRSPPCLATYPICSDLLRSVPSRSHEKVGFPAALVMGRNFLTPGHPGARVRNIRRKPGPKSYILMLSFSALPICDPCFRECRELGSYILRDMLDTPKL